MNEPQHSEIPPESLPIDIVDGGITVKYTDGREVFYGGEPEVVDSPHQTAPGKDIHVLVTDESATHGVLVYVNERKTEDEILESSGVGRVLLDEGAQTTLFPGVTIRGGSLRNEIVIDDALVDGRVFVFEEDQFEELAYEVC